MGLNFECTSNGCKTQNDNVVLTSISQSLLTIYPPGGFRALIGGRGGWPKVAEVTATGMYRYVAVTDLVHRPKICTYKNNPLPQLGGEKNKNSSERKGYFCWAAEGC